MTKKKKKKTGRKRTIAPKIVEQMFIDFVNGDTITAIAKKNKISKQRLSNISIVDGWKERRQDIYNRVSEQVDTNLIEELAKSKDKQLETAGMLLATIYEDIKEDYQNRAHPGYKRKISLNSALDFDRIIKTLYFIMNNGEEQPSADSDEESQENHKLDSSGNIQFSQKEKESILKGLANKLVVVKGKDQETSGNA